MYPTFSNSEKKMLKDEDYGVKQPRVPVTSATPLGRNAHPVIHWVIWGKLIHFSMCHLPQLEKKINMFTR